MMMNSFNEVDWECIKTVQCLAIDMVQKANSGHPGAPMGLAPLAHVLFSRHFKFNPHNPHWLNRDRFVLSNGHACALQYSMLHLLGTPGHPECKLTPGVEVTTGPLGQGFANAVGLAAAQVHLAARFNKPDYPIFDNFTFVVMGDGCMQEGVSSEAASLAGHLGLEKLIAIYDDNNITIDGATDLAFTENVKDRFLAYGFEVLQVSNGNDSLEAISKAIEEAKAIKGKPKLIIVKTIIGIHSKVAGTAKAHGSPLGANEVANVKEKLGFDPQKEFYVSSKVSDYYQQVAKRGIEENKKYDTLLEKYQREFPDLSNELCQRINKVLPKNLSELMPKYEFNDPELATRKCSEMAINSFASYIKGFIGGSADLTESNLTLWKEDCEDFQKSTPQGRYVRYGVREHAMFALNNGLAAYGEGLLIPFSATFLNFITYGFPAVRLAALSHFQHLFIMTHDSIGLGEDGPTHQPIEVLPLLRATPNLLVFRPADGNETSGAYISALKNTSGPSVVCLSRQKLPQLRGSSAESVSKGAYVIHKESSHLKVVLVSTGSEVAICVAVAQKNDSIRVVSMPCWELFELQDEVYRKEILPSSVSIVSVEAASTFGWSKYAHVLIGIDSFGKSGPYEKVYESFGLNPESVYQKIRPYLT